MWEILFLELPPLSEMEVLMLVVLSCPSNAQHAPSSFLSLLCTYNGFHRCEEIYNLTLTNILFVAGIIFFFNSEFRWYDLVLGRTFCCTCPHLNWFLNFLKTVRVTHEMDLIYVAL